MRLPAIIFDWAGTMVDFGSVAPVIAMRQAFAAEGVEITEADVRAGMGLAKRDHVVSILALPTVSAAWSAAHRGPATAEAVDRIFAAIGPLMAQAGAARADLIPGAADACSVLRRAGVRIGSTTGYTRAMMTPILERAAAQGYEPDVVLCAGEAPQGRPAPFMIWRVLEALGAWPASAVVKVDDAPVGIIEGKNAGCFTIGVAASGNAVGLDLAAYLALSHSDRMARVAAARSELLAAGADVVIDSVADLMEALRSRALI